ncbi:MAG: hypothetical protein ABR571_06400 [Jatrophihabitans sp.]|uniref:hypothetical protein n=1 Tax=Jatrophihabitans sp. TaxID=1932789 RepID=UPI003911AACE
MSNNLIMTAAAACASPSSMPASPILLPTSAVAWRDRVPATGVDAGIGNTSVFKTQSIHHNSIARELAVPVSAYRGVDAKQAAPPRGVLR